MIIVIVKKVDDLPVSDVLVPGWCMVPTFALSSLHDKVIPLSTKAKNQINSIKQEIN